MLANGHSRTWMISNTIVTITTSGTYIGLDGVCDNCLALRQRTANHTHKEKTKADTSAKQKNTGADGPTEDSASQTSSDQAQGAVRSRVTGTQAPAGTQRKSSIEGAAKTEENCSSVVSDRRHSEPFVPINLQNCQCVCQGWAEIFIRRPSGNISWIMRIQNRATLSYLDSDVSTAIVDDPQIGECKFGCFSCFLKTTSVPFIFKRSKLGDSILLFLALTTEIFPISFSTLFRRKRLGLTQLRSINVGLKLVWYSKKNVYCL